MVDFVPTNSPERVIRVERLNFIVIVEGKVEVVQSSSPSDSSGSAAALQPNSGRGSTCTRKTDGLSIECSCVAPGTSGFIYQPATGIIADLRCFEAIIPGNTLNCSVHRITLVIRTYSLRLASRSIATVLSDCAPQIKVVTIGICSRERIIADICVLVQRLGIFKMTTEIIRARHLRRERIKSSNVYPGKATHNLPVCET